MPPFDFTGTTSLVTGASSGLGAEFARQLADRGGNLVLVARSADRLAALADELRARHRVTVTTVPADLSRAEQVGRVAAHAAATHVEVMVNAVAVVDLAHAVLPWMLERRRGGIITVASSVAFQPSPHHAVYGATKAFALAFSEALWAETRGTGVRILALCPGPVATGFLASLDDPAATSSIIYGRTADPADVVRAALHGFDHDAMTIIPGR